MCPQEGPLGQLNAVKGGRDGEDCWARKGWHGQNWHPGKRSLKSENHVD